MKLYFVVTSYNACFIVRGEVVRRDSETVLAGSYRQVANADYGHTGSHPVKEDGEFYFEDIRLMVEIPKP